MMKIAICDDNKVDRDKICNILSNDLEQRFATDDIFVFESSTSLLNATNKTFYDIVFLDIDMPEMNGIEIIKARH